uniref:Uncharacterized protein n=1 Tax=Salix viminalis TaxID=40686 RepID=A0A6N2N0Y7_SALVM
MKNHQIRLDLKLKWQKQSLQLHEITIYLLSEVEKQMKQRQESVNERASGGKPYFGSDKLLILTSIFSS